MPSKSYGFARTICLLLVPCCLAVAARLWGADPVASGSGPQLDELRELVGAWRGVGQPRRGSTRDAWQEAIEWRFRFEDGVASLVSTSKDSRWMSRATLKSGMAGGMELSLLPTQEPTQPRQFLGTKRDDGSWVFEAKTPLSGSPDRLSLRIVAGGDRLVTLFETRSSNGRFARLAEVGYTREGANFAQESYPECIVTGGRGTIAVEYKGKTYYVCCSGCRELFLESPDDVISEYERKKQEPSSE